MELIIIIAAFGIMLASLAGVLFTVARAGSWVEDNLIYLNTFAAGVFVVVSISILREAFEFSVNDVVTFGAVLLGFFIFFFAEYLLPESHCHHDDENCIHNDKDKRKAWKVLLSDGVHNTGDGILLVPVFLIDIQLGIVAAIGIFIHELVQEVAEFFVLKRAGYSTLQALQRNFIVSSTILIGVVAGSLLLIAESLVSPLIGFAAGGFIHIVLVDLLPLTIKEARERKKYIEFLVAFLFGIGLIFSVNALSAEYLERSGLSGHGHLHEDGVHDDGHEHEDDAHTEDEPHTHDEHAEEGHQHEDDHAHEDHTDEEVHIDDTTPGGHTI
jgi:zinc transporter ZupT